MRQLNTHEESADLRDIKGGYFFWTEHELISVFVPLIGPNAAWLYQNLCRLIPLAQARAAERMRMDITTDVCAESSGLSRSVVDREIKVLLAIGMIIARREIRNRPATYTLVPLRELAKLGTDELKRRIGVPHRDTDSGRASSGAAKKVAPASAQTGVDSRDADHSAIRQDESPANSPGGGDVIGIPGWDTESAPEMSVEKTKSVSQKTASVSQDGAPLKEEEEQEQESQAPPTPSGGVSGLDLDRWRDFKALLKAELTSAPIGVARSKGFTTVVPGMEDYDGCFRDWWLVDVRRDVRRNPGVITLRTEAVDIVATGAGVAKYSASRLERIVRKYFGLNRDVQVVFDVIACVPEVPPRGRDDPDA